MARTNVLNLNCFFVKCGTAVGSPGLLLVQTGSVDVLERGVVNSWFLRPLAHRNFTETPGAEAVISLLVQKN